MYGYWVVSVVAAFATAADRAVSRTQVLLDKLALLARLVRMHAELRSVTFGRARGLDASEHADGESRGSCADPKVT